MTATEQYPLAPGYKTLAPETSAAAAADVAGRAAVLRTLVVTCYHQHGKLTADECAELLGESILSVRPRVSELRKCNPPVLEDSGERRRNKSGKTAAAWQLIRRQTQPELGLV
jgi:hypothetical protein